MLEGQWRVQSNIDGPPTKTSWKWTVHNMVFHLHKKSTIERQGTQDRNQIFYVGDNRYWKRTYKKNMAKPKGGLPILLQSVHTYLSILCNIWMEDPGNKISCAPSYWFRDHARVTHYRKSPLLYFTCTYLQAHCLCFRTDYTVDMKMYLWEEFEGSHCSILASF